MGMWVPWHTTVTFELGTIKNKHINNGMLLVWHTGDPKLTHSYHCGTQRQVTLKAAIQ